MNTSAGSYLNELLTKFHDYTTDGFPSSRDTKHTLDQLTTGQFIGWWTWCTLGLPNFAWKCRFTHSFMNSQPNFELQPPLDSHCQGLQITLWVGWKPVGSSVGALGAHLVYRILHENIGSLIASWILNRIPKFNHCRIPTIKGYKSHSGSAKNWLVDWLVHMVHTRSTEFCMKMSVHS